jgi:hypothetical protein
MKTCPSVTRSTAHPTWVAPGFGLGVCDEWQATNRLRHGTARINGIAYTDYLSKCEVSDFFLK